MKGKYNMEDEGDYEQLWDLNIKIIIKAITIERAIEIGKGYKVIDSEGKVVANVGDALQFVGAVPPLENSEV